VQRRRARIASSLVVAAVAIGAMTVTTTQAGPPVRIWAADVALDFESIGTLGHGSTASLGNRAIIAWIYNGQVEVSERNATTRSWGAKVTVGASSGPTAVALGADGSAAVAYSTGAGIAVAHRAAATKSWTTKTLAVPDGAAARFIQVTLSNTGAVTALWLPPKTTNGVRIGFAARSSATLARVGYSPTIPVASAALVEQPGHAPAAVWLPDGAGVKVLATARGTALSQWSAPTVALSTASSSLFGVTASMGSDGQIVAAWSDSNPAGGGISTSTRSVTGAWSASTHIAGTDWHVAAPSVASTAGGAATLVWSRTADEGMIPSVTHVWVTDRSAATTPWTPKVELPFIAGNSLSAYLDIVPGVARGTDGTWFVTWSGYGSTNGYVPTFLGKGGVLRENNLGGIYSDDNDLAFTPMLLADGTAVHAARVVELGFTGWGIRVREGRLLATGPAAVHPAVMVGTPKLGVRLSCMSPVFAPSPSSKAFAWLRNGAVIARATATSYVPVVADVGKSVRCRVTGTTNTGALAGSTAVLSNAATIAPGSAPKATAGSVAVVGNHRTGAAQTCRLGTWSPAFAYTHTVRWLRDGVVLVGIVTTTYTPAASMRGHKLACRVTSARPGYLMGTATSAAVPLV
jgi:hypothetical protein